MKKRLLSIILLSLLMAGCGRAPSVDVLGSFFPVWMFCLCVAIGLTFVVRLILLRARLDSQVGPVALFYPCLVILFTSGLWLVFFR